MTKFIVFLFLLNIVGIRRVEGRGTSYEKQRQKLARNGSVDTQKEIVMLSCHFFYLITFNKTFVFIKKYLKLANIS